MQTNLHKILFERIAKQSRPIFQGTELALSTEDDVSIWLNNGVLKETDAPTIIHKNGSDGIRREFEVFKHDDKFFGKCSDADDPHPSIELSAEELLRYRLSRHGLAKVIADANDFDFIPFEDTEEIPQIGEIDGQAICLLQPAPTFDLLLPKLYMLSEQFAGQPIVIVSPIHIPIPVPYKKTVSDLGISFSKLGDSAASPFCINSTTTQQDPDYSIDFKGDAWVFRFNGKPCRLESDKDDIRFMILLLLKQGEEISNLDIWLKIKPPIDPYKFEAFRKSGVFLGQEMTTVTAIRKAEEIVENAEEGISSARQKGDQKTIDVIQQAKEDSEKFLKKHRGKDGKPRKESDIYDSARTTVARAKKNSIKLLRATEFGDDLADHLQTSINAASAGHRLYNPSPRIPWVVKYIPKILL